MRREFDGQIVELEIRGANCPIPRQEGMESRKDQGSTAPSDGVHRRLPREVIELTAERLRVIAEPNRMALLEALNACGEASVQELADCIGASHQKTSKHLAVLFGAGMVSRRRGEGTTVLYTLIDWTGWWVIEQIARWVGAGFEQESGQARGESPAA